MRALYPWLQPYWQNIQQRAVQGLPHALLTTGVKGIGKQQLNEYLAQWLLCAKAKSQQLLAACGQCQSCLLWQAGTHPDVVVCEPEESSRQIRVDGIRKVNEFLAQTPQISHCQVVLVRPVEVMNINAANALLKTLEEPAGQSYLLLDTERYGSVLPTIRSRCQRISLAVPSPTQAQQWLQEQGIFAEDAALALQVNQGAPLAAQAWLTQEKDQQWAWLEQLGQWHQQSIRLIDLSSQWQKLDLQQLLTWFYNTLAELIKRQMKVPEVALSLPSSHLTALLSSTLDVRKLLTLQRKIQRILGQLMSGVGNYNKQLLIESLLIEWQQLHYSGE